MDRAERIGLAAAVGGHVVLFGLLSVGFLATPNPLKLKQQPVEVSLVPDVAIEQASPKPAEAATSQAPEVGPPEEAAPPAPAEAEPEPEPQPAPAPPTPQPEPAPAKPAPAKPAPRPAPKAEPKPAPKPAAKPAPAPKPAPAKPASAKPAPARPAAAPAAKPRPATPARGTGASPAATAAKPRGGRLGNDFLKGLTDQPSRSTDAAAAPAARMGAQQQANIGSAIKRQVQPCANRQVTPGPGAERIQVTINLRLNRDGSLAARPRVTGHAGVDDDNRRYVDRVDDLAIATFVGCAPLQGLPPELYDVQNGWSNFNLRYKLPG